MHQSIHWGTIPAMLPDPEATAPPPQAGDSETTPSFALPFGAPSHGTLPMTMAIQAAASAAAIAPAVAAPQLIEELGLGTAAVGVYVAILYLSAAVTSQWSAALVKRWGPIRCSQIGLALCALGLGLVGVPNIGLAIVGAVVLGAGYGPITPASSEMLIRTTAPARVALVFSIKQTGVPIGGIVAGLTIPFVLESTGLAWALGQVALMCVLSAMSAQLLRIRLDSSRDRSSHLPTPAHMADPIRFVWSNQTLRRLALCTLVFSTVQLSLTSYTVSFLTGELRWGLIAAGAALSVSQVAGVIGRILWGAVADRWHASLQTLLGLAAATALAGLAMSLLNPGTPHAWAVLLLAAYGGTAMGWNGVYLSIVARLVPSERAAMATAGSLFFTYMGIVVGVPVFGMVSSAIGSLGLGFALLAIPLAWAVWTLRQSAVSM